MIGIVIAIYGGFAATLLVGAAAYLAAGRWRCRDGCGKLEDVARPRITESYGGTGLGALLGGLLLAPAAAGAFIGSAANPTKPLPLDAALAQFIADKGLQFGGFERLRWNSVRVVFGHGVNFFYVDATVPPNRAQFPSIEALEDALYDVAIRQIDEQVMRLGFR